jgi:hypothetical protein
MADLLLAELVRVLRQLPEPVNVTAEELCDALWLYQQGVGAEASTAQATSLAQATIAAPSGPVDSTARAGHDQDSVVTVVLPPGPCPRHPGDKGCHDPDRSARGPCPAEGQGDLSDSASASLRPVQDASRGWHR